MNEIEKLKAALTAIAANPADAAKIAQDALAKPQDGATQIPMDDCGLMINCGRDGTWLHFSSAAGLHASLNVENIATDRGRIVDRALLAWCEDRRAQAAQLAS